MKLWLRNLIFIGLCLAVAGLVAGRLLKREPFKGPDVDGSVVVPDAGFQKAVQNVNHAFAAEWKESQIEPAPAADDLTLARRLSLALTGSIPSLEEVRALESVEDMDRVQWWLSHLFDDRRYGG